MILPNESNVEVSISQPQETLSFIRYCPHTNFRIQSIRNIRKELRFDRDLSTQPDEVMVRDSSTMVLYLIP